MTLRQFGIDLPRIGGHRLTGTGAAQELEDRGILPKGTLPADDPDVAFRQELPLLYSDRILVLHQIYREGIT